MPLSMYGQHLFAILNFVLTLIFISLILRSRRPPGNTLAWLGFVFLFPYIGIPFFLFLSDRKFQSRMQKKQALYAPAPDLIPTQEGSVEKILASLGIPPPKPHQHATLITSGEYAYKTMMEMIEAARHHICITAFILANDDVGKSLITLLEKKAEEGIAVHILLDSFGSFWVRRPSFKAFKQKGGKVVYFNPVFHLSLRSRANFRNHRKWLIVDSQKALLGGMNVAEQYMGRAPNTLHWTDLGLTIDGTAVQDIQNIFSEDWKFATGEDFVCAQPSGEDKSGDSVLQVIASGPDVIGDPLYDTLTSIIYGATSRVWIATPYFIPDESLVKALELAARRGVSVHILVPAKSNHLLADLARGSYLRQLAAAGCRIFLARKMMHAKAVLVDDGFALIGSANFDMRSLLLNYEIGILLRSGNAVKALEAWFNKLFLESGTSDFRVSYWRDLTEGVGRILGPLI